MNKNNFQLYQGDISIISLEKLPTGIKLEELKDNLIVAYGEITGHKHQVVCDRETATEIKWAKYKDGYILKVSNGEAKLEHDTHGTQVIPQGITFIGSQWEYDELSELKKVQD